MEGKKDGEIDGSPTPDLSKSNFNNIVERLSSNIHTFVECSPAASDKVDSSNIDTNETTASQNINVAEDETAPVEPLQDLSGADFANDSVTTIESRFIHAAGIPASADKSAAMDIDDVQSKRRNDAMDAGEISAGIVDSVDINNMQAHQGDDVNNAKMPTAPPPSTAAMKETPAPDWLRKMLVYLRGVSDSAEWQDLVLALLKFENLNPPSGVGIPLLNFDMSFNSFHSCL